MADKLIYPLKTLNVSQSYTGIYSHKGHTTGNFIDFPWDEAGSDTGRSYMYAPCDLEVKRIYGVGDGGANTIWLQSTEKVKFADGTEDYFSLMVIHPNDDDLSKISVGQKFNKGSAMFREGTDGNATGNHFHFSAGKGQLTGNGWTKNSNDKWVLTTSGGTYPPEKLFYIDKSFTTVKSSKDLPFKTLEGDFASSVTEAPTIQQTESKQPTSFTGTSLDTPKEPINITYETKVLPRRVLDTGSQPLLAFVDVYVNGRYLSFKPPQYIVSLEFNRLGDNVASFILNVFDKNWEDLEALFSNHFKNIQIQYGIVGGKESKLYNLMMTDYSVRFNTAGTHLTIRGNSTGVVDNLRRISLDTRTTNPTQAVMAICASEGWLVLPQNFDLSEDVELSTQDTIALINEYPITYIKNHLAPIAKRVGDGESGFMFYLDDTTIPPTAHFKVADIVPTTHKTYIYMKGLDSPIIDLDLSVNGVYGGAINRVTTEVESSFVDPKTKEHVIVKEDLSSTRNIVAGEFSHTSSKQSKKIIDAGGGSRAYMNAVVNYKLTSSIPYEGVLRIIGDPEININDVIRIIIVTDKGNLHHSSGLYLVTDVTDSIQNGSMTTALNIMRREDIEKGLEIVNYRTLLK